eukprot:347853-Chlamydomonas_euryale.AAC.1
MALKRNPTPSHLHTSCTHTHAPAVQEREAARALECMALERSRMVQLEYDLRLREALARHQLELARAACSADDHAAQIAKAVLAGCRCGSMWGGRAGAATAGGCGASSAGA